MKQPTAPDKRRLIKGTEYALSEIRSLRVEAGLPETVKVAAVAAVVDRVGGDFDLALSALTMEPRPAWVAEALGLHPDRAVCR